MKQITARRMDGRRPAAAGRQGRVADMQKRGALALIKDRN